MPELNVPNEPANYLLIAGIRDKRSLGWSAAQAWLDESPEHQVVATTRSKQAQDFVRKQGEVHDGRLSQIQVDWSENGAYLALAEELAKKYGSNRQFAGFVHAIAGADPSNFRLPAHELDPEVYINAFRVSAVSLQQGVRAVKDVLTPNGGIVTYGFGRPGTVVEGYGGAMAMAKGALSQLVKELAFSLGRAEPNARTLEIVTGYIPSRSGSGVAYAQKERIRSDDVAHNFAESSPLAGSNSQQQWKAAGKLAVAFMGPDYQQMTGNTIFIDGGWSLGGPNLLPR